jgi:predicted RNA-binding Zn ribbon-like protein
VTQPIHFREVVNNHERIQLKKLATQTKTLPDFTNEPIKKVSERTQTFTVPGKQIYSTKYYQPTIHRESVNLNLK